MIEYLNRIVKPGQIQCRSAFIASFVLMAAIFILDIETDYSIPLQGLYVFPLAMFMLQCGRKLPAIVLFVAVTAFQVVVIFTEHFGLLSTIVDICVAVVSSFLIMYLASSARSNYLKALHEVAREKLARSYLVEGERKYRELFDNSPTGMTEVDIQSGRIVHANTVAQRMYGYSEEEFRSKSVNDFNFPDDLSEMKKYHDLLLSGEINNHFIEKRHLRKDGSNFWAQISISSLKGKDGKAERIIASVIDITDRKFAQDAIQQQKNFSDDIINSLPGIFYMLDAGGRFVRTNTKFLTETGYSPDELDRIAALDMFERENKDLIARKIQEAFQLGETFVEAELLIKSGRKIPYFFTGHRTSIDGRQYLVGLGTDITERKTIEKSILLQSQKFETLLRAAGDGIHVLDLVGNVLQANDAFCHMLGYTHDEVLGMNVTQWDAKFSTEELKERLPMLMRQSVTFETRHRKRDGIILEVEVNTVGVEIDGEQMLFCSSRDITQRKQLEESMNLAAQIYRSSSEAVIVTDEKNLIVDVNPAFTEQTGYTLEEVTGKNPSMMQSGRHDKAFYQEMWQVLLEKGRWQGEIWDRRKDGSLHVKLANISIIRHPDGSIYRHVAQFFDITDKKQKEELIWTQANYDTLTKLPNRRLFIDRLEQEAKKSRRTRSSLALLFIDLDRFKEVNDTLGHAQGDVLLVEAAQRINWCVRETDTIARLGGDEFTVILTEFGERVYLERIAQDIIKSLSRPFILGEGNVAYVSASIGIALFPDEASNIEELMKHADQAMYAAKTQGRNRFNYFTPSMQMEAQEKLALTNDLRQALVRNELEVYYQPIVEMSNGRIGKAEALLRWKHPARGMVSPDIFIPLAEESGLIVEIGEWVFQKAITGIERWQNQFGRIIQISVNKSPVQFEQKQGEAWMDRLENSGLPGNCLTVEITEGLLIKDSLKVRQRLIEFRNKGIEVSIDDFGTGFSALSYLKQFDIDYLKIDRSFIDNLTGDASDRALTEAIVVMAHKLGIKTIAEGVETVAQRDLLTAFGCDYLQGYLYSHPLTEAEFEKMLETSKPVGEQ